MPSTAYKSLKMQLGSQNAAFELQELALRELRWQADQSSDQTQYLKQLCSRHGIKVDSVDSNSISREIGRLRILLAVGSFERFLHELKSENCVAAHVPMFADGAGLSDIMQTLRQRHLNHPRRLVLNDFVNYYITIRNEAAHPYDLRQFSGEVSRRAEHLNACEKRSALGGWLGDPVPSSSNHMDFSHYILCSRIVKVYAFEIWRSQIESLTALPDDWKWKSRFSRLEQNPVRHRSACIADIRTRMNLDKDEAEAIYEELKTES